MAKGKRKVPDINSSSTADIAFLLLIFFLITTSMDTDRGLARRLPPPPENTEKPDDQKVKQRNVLQIYLNMYDQLMVNGEIMNVQQLRAKTKEFIANKYNDESLPERVSKDVNFFGPMMITEKHVVSLQNDRSSSYQAYIDVQNELERNTQSWTTNNRKPFVKSILRRFLKLNLKNMEKRSNGKI